MEKNGAYNVIIFPSEHSPGKIVGEINLASSVKLDLATLIRTRSPESRISSSGRDVEEEGWLDTRQPRVRRRAGSIILISAPVQSASLLLLFYLVPRSPLSCECADPRLYPTIELFRALSPLVNLIVAGIAYRPMYRSVFPEKPEGESSGFTEAHHREGEIGLRDPLVFNTRPIRIVIRSETLFRARPANVIGGNSRLRIDMSRFLHVYLL